MIKMKALKTFRGTDEEGRPKRGREFSTTTERRANELETAGLAHRVIQQKAEPALQNKMEPPPVNKAAEQGPFVSAGGETGAVATSPSSPQEPARAPRRSRRSGDDLLS
jgi:hypothetical protein